MSDATVTLIKLEFLTTARLQYYRLPYMCYDTKTVRFSSSDSLEESGQACVRSKLTSQDFFTSRQTASFLGLTNSVIELTSLGGLRLRSLLWAFNQLWNQQTAAWDVMSGETVFILGTTHSGFFREYFFVQLHHSCLSVQTPQQWAGESLFPPWE